MRKPDRESDREVRIARILRPLGKAPLTRAQAERAGQLLAVHPSTVYRLRERFLRDPVTSALKRSVSGRGTVRHQRARARRIRWRSDRCRREASTWLGAAVPDADAAMRLARLCRMPSDEIRRLQPKEAGNLCTRFFYCHKCLYLNPIDVTAPYWKAQWLFESLSPCPRHPDSGSWVTRGHLRNHPNMRRLLRFISRKRHQWLCERRGFMYARGIR